VYYLYHALWVVIKCVESEADADLHLGTTTLTDISSNLARYSRHSTSAARILEDMVTIFKNMYTNVVAIIDEHEDIREYIAK
jgi:hypothetical protein